MLGGPLVTVGETLHARPCFCVDFEGGDHFFEGFEEGEFLGLLGLGKSCDQVIREVWEVLFEVLPRRCERLPVLGEVAFAAAVG